MNAVSAVHSWRAARRRLIPARFGLWIGTGLVAGMVFSIVLGPVLLGLDPLRQDLTATLLAPGSSSVQGTHLLGTDDLGRDVLARVLVGGRIPVLVGLAAVAIGSVLGTLGGLLAGFFGGWVDAVLSRITDVQLALPAILVALTLLAFSGQNMAMLIAVIALSGWPPYFRLIRSAALQLRSLPFIDAAISSGQSRFSVIVRHMVPNVRTLLVMCMTLDFSRAILMEAGLSFLGLGISPPAADWGLMVSQGQPFLASAWWIPAFPGLAVVVLVLAVNLIGDWLSTRESVQVDVIEKQVVS